MKIGLNDNTFYINTGDNVISIDTKSQSIEQMKDKIGFKTNNGECYLDIIDNQIYLVLNLNNIYKRELIMVIGKGDL